MDIDLRVVTQVSARFGEIDDLDARGESFLVLIRHQGRIGARGTQNDIRQFLDTDHPFLATAYVVHFLRDEAVDYVGERAAGVLHVIEDALVTAVHGERQPHQRVIDKNGDHAPVAAVIFKRTVAADRAHAHRLAPEHLSVVQALQLPGPLGNGVVVHLLDGDRFHHVLGHQTLVIAVNLRAGEENHLIAVLLLEAQHVLGAGHVGAPQVGVVVLTVPAAVLRSQMVDVIERTLPEDGVHLLERTDVGAQVLRVFTLQDVRSPDLVTAGAQFLCQIGADETAAAGDENVSQ